MDKRKIERAQTLINEARSLVEEVRDDEQNAFDEKSDKWRESEAGDKADARIASLSEIVDTLESVDSEMDVVLND